MWRILLNLFVYLLMGIYSSAQVIESNSSRERNLAFEVKQIDEFIERFNFEKNTLLLHYLKENYPKMTVTRASLIRSLFNRKIFRTDQRMEEFIDRINQKSNSLYIDFYHTDWYAEAHCEFRYKGSLLKVVLLLKIQVEDNGGAKWMIVRAHCRSLGPDLNWRPIVQHGSGRKFINPMSHATNFIALAKTFRDKKNITDYLAPEFFDHSNSGRFLHFFLNNHPEYLFVRKIRYHFLLSEGWIFAVDRYLRPGINSGWLISNVIKAGEGEMKRYAEQLTE